VRAVIYQIAGPAALSDLTQEAFLRIWHGLAGFQGKSQLKSWVYRIATNVALDYLRQDARRGEVTEMDFSDFPSGETGTESAAADRQLVAVGLNALSPDHRAVVVLALVHELSVAEIAGILGISEGTVKSRLHYGKEHFRQILRKEGEMEWART
jgi:RNA polymerase sigma-70 factor (ECF subfamily)